MNNTTLCFAVTLWKLIGTATKCERYCFYFFIQDHPREDTDNHATVEYETYLSRPDVHKAFRCSKHNKRITKICYTCDELGCDCCEEEKGCKSKNSLSLLFISSYFRLKISTMRTMSLFTFSGGAWFPAVTSIYLWLPVWYFGYGNWAP